MFDMDQEVLKVLSHRKRRAVGIPMLLFSVEKGKDLIRQNPIAFFSAIWFLLGKAQNRSGFTAQGVLLLGVTTEEEQKSEHWPQIKIYIRPIRDPCSQAAILPPLFTAILAREMNVSSLRLLESLFIQLILANITRKDGTIPAAYACSLRHVLAT